MDAIMEHVRCSPGMRRRAPRCEVRLAWLAAALGLTPQLLAAQPSRPGGATAVVSGTVYDSVARRVLPGVTVQYIAADSLASRGFSARTDSAGRYELSDVPAGRYLAGFFHTANDTLGIETGPRLVELSRGEQRLDLATRSPGTVINSMCAGIERADSTGLLIGHVRDGDAELPIVGAIVAAEWTETTIEGANIDERTARLTAATQGPGWFAICGVPSDALISVRATTDADSSGVVMVNVPANDVRHLTFLIGGATSVPNPTAGAADRRDSAGVSRPASVLRGRSRLTGTVRNDKGQPVHNAHVMLWGTEIEVVTNDRGVFTLDSLPGGTHTLEVRAVRHAPAHAIVHLSARRPAMANVTLAQAPAVLSSVTVRGELVYSQRLAGFDERRGEGWGLLGHFMSPSEIERRPRTRLAALLQGMSGVFVDNRRSGATVRMRASGDPNGFCTPSLYVDGTRDADADFNRYQSDLIAGVEVYVREAWRPSEFIDGNACGAVVIWTRPAPRRNPP